MKNELTAKAESFAYRGRMPMISAATSISRVAIQVRPMRPRTRFFATTANSTRIPRHSRYFSSAESKVKAKNVIGGAGMGTHAGVLGDQATPLKNPPTRNSPAGGGTPRGEPLMGR